LTERRVVLIEYLPVDGPRDDTERPVEQLLRCRDRHGDGRLKRWPFEEERAAGVFEEERRAVFLVELIIGHGAATGIGYGASVTWIV
jgi:hypothetical protein